MRALASLGILLCFVGCTRQCSQERDVTAHSPIADANREPNHSGSRARVLYAVAADGGVYLGDQKVNYDVAHDVIVRFIEKEKVTNLMLLATDLARYGDFVRLYTSFDQERYTVAKFPTHSRTAGFRLPLFGSFRKVGCCWIDEENSEEFP